MSGLFPARGTPGDPWFRLGRLEVGTTMLVVLVVAASWLGWVVAPGLADALAFAPGLVAAGEVWRVVTWPLANGLSLWGVIYLFFFWWFGSELEQAIGRRRMLWFLLGVWGSLTLASAVVGLAVGGGLVLAGIGLIQFTVLLVWIAEYPTRPFFFGIPAWVIGVVLVVVQGLGLVAARSGASLVSLLLSLALVAVVARATGLLGSYEWIPGGRRRTRPARAPRATRTSRPKERHDQRRTSDRERLDALLDRINERGLDSLTPSERRELMRLRERLRGS